MKAWSLSATFEAVHSGVQLTQWVGIHDQQGIAGERDGTAPRADWGAANGRTEVRPPPLAESPVG